ncbi:MAG: hypothetical protein V8R46_08425 [Eubacterium ramulus]
MAADWDVHRNSFADPVLSIITSIFHTEILGDTIAQIAGKKAGIIKPGRSGSFCMPMIRKLPKSSGRTAGETHSPCTATGEKNVSYFLELKNNFIDFSLSTAYDKKS